MTIVLYLQRLMIASENKGFIQKLEQSPKCFYECSLPSDLKTEVSTICIVTEFMKLRISNYVVTK